MKTQQRKFVVEFKSTRRRTKAAPASIWGGTDLKALARETEADAPHLFGQAPATEIVVNKRERAQEPTAILSEEFEVASAEPTSVAVPEMAMPEPIETETEVISSPQPVPVQSEPSSPKLPMRRRKVRVADRSRKTGGIVRSSDAQAAGAIDELDTLEDENRRLKDLLAAQLREENVRLEMMLHRFGG